ncbi:hypothetical protein KC19_7G071800 [Ceratodon purpureus]|uniref:Uncharacterized protein n=1 Tax=Ceratodon purpureus TaxID=3225 RepID=A0A8T0H8J2_CERPU|nr:hypothetical protein KC19_7G071800 [Ceratodon purpureus]
MLEAIRLTIINNLLQYHPESSEQLAMGVALGGVAPKKQVFLFAGYFLFVCLIFLELTCASVGANDD